MIYIIIYISLYIYIFMSLYICIHIYIYHYIYHFTYIYTNIKNLKHIIHPRRPHLFRTSAVFPGAPELTHRGPGHRNPTGRAAGGRLSNRADGVQRSATGLFGIRWPLKMGFSWGLMGFNGDSMKFTGFLSHGGSPSHHRFRY